MGFYGPLGPGGFRRRGRRRGLVVGAAAGAAVAHQAGKPKAGTTVAPEAASQPAENDYMTELTQLRDLKSQNLITEGEHEAKKKQILGIE
ncbi:MAG TPA: hypothetical protein VMS08_02275 [Candidatus Saccharimonadia bacterium]|nr:hypothetical protein [Candidatus Saccharimonadia bacterium]